MEECTIDRNQEISESGIICKATRAVSCRLFEVAFCLAKTTLGTYPRFEGPEGTYCKLPQAPLRLITGQTHGSDSPTLGDCNSKLPLDQLSFFVFNFTNRHGTTANFLSRHRSAETQCWMRRYVRGKYVRTYVAFRNAPTQVLHALHS